MIESFETDRLRAERLTLDNAWAFRAMEADANVMSGLGGIQPVAVVDAKIQRNLDHWTEQGFGLWILFDKAGNHVGRGAIRRLKMDDEPLIEIGYALMPDYWRQGLASELTKKFIELARQLSFPELAAIILPDNIGSLNVVKKAGFSFDRECVHYGQPCSLYKLAIDISRCPI